ncbi:hypothetical protein VPH46_09815 [Sphingomonas sp. MJ1 (PH-R8)]|uniref:hypothetical protein n=1 Tax=unclassified Sphingomonas TaxID=196159 RepID=UPI001EF58B26|nr:hypothetical protein [Sphingomonas sp. ACRSK]MCG7349832.1 hypothetical protein [Sphingomonas sp. ACRSK]
MADPASLAVEGQHKLGNGAPTDPAVQPILEEAWAIAIDLRRDLGLSEAIGWADAYLEEVRKKESSTAAARWVVVISALAELAQSSVH